MIQDFMAAEKVTKLLDRAHALLMESLKLVHDSCPEEEHRQFRKGMAHVDGRLYFLLMEPIYRDHPSLAPANTPQEFRDRWNDHPLTDTQD